MGAFYVDQKKKVLPPSTLPSEHKQWGTGTITGTGYITFPVAFLDADYKVLITEIEDTINKLNYKANIGDKSKDKVYVGIYLDKTYSPYPASFDWIAIK